MSARCRIGLHRYSLVAIDIYVCERCGKTIDFAAAAPVSAGGDQ